MKIKERIRRLLRCTRGMTLVESLVGLAVLSMLMLMLAMTIGMFLSVYYKTTVYVRAGQIGDILHDEIAEVVRSASDVETRSAGGSPSGTSIRISDTGKALFLTDAEGRPVEITGDKFLNMKYYFNDSVRVSDVRRAEEFYHDLYIDVTFHEEADTVIRVQIDIIKDGQKVHTGTNLIRLLDTKFGS